MIKRSERENEQEREREREEGKGAKLDCMLATTVERSERETSLRGNLLRFSLKCIRRLKLDFFAELPRFKEE